MNITKEEIRDIIEESVYVGEGTILGAMDAAISLRAAMFEIDARITALEAEYRKAIEALTVAFDTLNVLDALYPGSHTITHALKAIRAVNVDRDLLEDK